jgi:hypothetical protein
VSQAEALVAVTNSILETEELNEAQKNALLEQVAFLTKQATLPANERKPGVVKSILSGIKEGAGPAGAVANAWSSAEPIIKGFFGLS